MANIWTIMRAKERNPADPTHDPRDLAQQMVISVVFGLSAFLTFCALRPRWTGLYAARKKQKNAASKLPDLPNTFFGWIPTLYRITEEQVLASAGLDAFVFLAFFKMAIKFLAVVLFFALTVIYPVHQHFDKSKAISDEDNSGGKQNETSLNEFHSEMRKPKEPSITDFMWIYVVFVYLFSGYAIYLIVTETKRIIRIRQRVLGTQSTITDRTIKLSGIPSHLRSEPVIKETIEKLEIGKVESVIICKDWKELDNLVAERMSVLRKLEEAWTVHFGLRRAAGHSESQSDPQTRDEDDEQSTLLNGHDSEQSHVTPYANDRPTTRIWFGFWNLQSRRIDAINYYEERLRRLDEKVTAARKKEFQPMPVAFVTMDSIEACQMAVQAILDPEPMQLVAKLAPAPADVVWRNTYLSRTNRMTRAWAITFIILLLTVFWSILLIPLAGLINLDNIAKVLPRLADVLRTNETVESLASTGLPTLLISLLNVLVPYLYDWLANCQGMISQGDIEMSIISKNFSFTFVNLFLVFTVFGTFSNALSNIGDDVKEKLKQLTLTEIANVLARSLGELGPFYMNLIVLQGFGLFPFRLLQFGSVALYPVSLWGSKTPRDYAELVQPPVFSYGFFLPQTILIFIICIVYSILPSSQLVSLFGLFYFMIGSFIYKYQLLYAMDHRRHSTGRAWTIICNRVIVGLLVFQVAMLGQLALLSAIRRSVLIFPLFFGTIWFFYFYRRTYEPLMKFIALRSLHNEDQNDGVSVGESRYVSETNDGRAVDEDEDTGLRYINPSLIIPLEDVWIANKRINGSNHAVLGASEENV